MTSDRSHRRDFVRTLALGAAATTLTDPPVAPAADDPPVPEASPEVDARMALVVARYGDKLDEESRKAIRHDVETVVRRGKALRAFGLSNGDAPFPIFRPYREALSS